MGMWLARRFEKVESFGYILVWFGLVWVISVNIGISIGALLYMGYLFMHEHGVMRRRLYKIPKFPATNTPLSF